MEKLQWSERKFVFGFPAGMLPFFIERLVGTTIRIEQKMRQVPEEVLSHNLDGKWSVKQNIGHLADVDLIVLKRIDEITRGLSTMSPANIPLQRDYNAQSVEEILKHFKSGRFKTIEKYTSLSLADASKSSVHPRLQLAMTPVDLAWFDAEHDDHHLVRINEIISTLTAKN